ncbi:MAG TPA: LysR family transcriptional regulator [Baekduia sp.]|uniref:LysR family transcriptional regulator n=1 Tax=Baekduia sp. TaxID=2600305 RepID=UPI002CEB5602|nr:LysR family transcriptional regulator [Baekduia sp.]HMJ35989.1 LysR family transcriptional regulator [Baekduia sp.]
MASVANPLDGGELAAFVAAFEAGTMHGAADALQLTQSAVTKRIQMLERRVGGRLFERGRFGVRPTELGSTVYPAAKRALEALGSVVELVELSRAQGSVDLRLSASQTIGEFLLPGWLADFRRERPEVHPRLQVVNSHDALEAIRENRSEIGFVEGPDSPAGLQALTVARDEIVVVVAAEHPWAGRRAVTPRDLVGESYLAREEAAGTRAVATAALARAGVDLSPALEAASIQSLKRALVGGGFTLLSRLTIEAEERAGVLVGLPVRGVDLHRELRAIHRRRPALSAGARAFWRWLGRHTA